MRPSGAEMPASVVPAGPGSIPGTAEDPSCVGYCAEPRMPAAGALPWRFFPVRPAGKARRTLIRPLETGDADGVLDHYFRLSDGERRLRFCGSVGEAGLRAQVNEISLGRMGGFAAWHGGVIAGLVVFPDPDEVRGDEIEIAVSVLADYQGNGLAGGLMRMAAEGLSVRGKSRMLALTLARNTPMAALVRGMGGRIVAMDAGEVIFAMDVGNFSQHADSPEKNKSNGEENTAAKRLEGQAGDDPGVSANSDGPKP